MTLWTWLGAIVVNQQGQSALQVLEAGQGLFISPGGIIPLNTSPANNNPRPDGVVVPSALFSTNDIPENTEGLYVFVRDGHIEITTDSSILELGRGEAGFAGNGGVAGRPSFVPRFLDFDSMPMPNSKNPMLTSILSENGVKTAGQCK